MSILSMLMSINDKVTHCYLNVDLEKKSINQVLIKNLFYEMFNIKSL